MARIVSRSAQFSLLALACLPAWAADVGVVGLFPNKAVLVVDGGGPRTLSVGEKTREGVRLLAVDRESATVEVDGRRHRLMIGEHAVSRPGKDGGTVTLTSDVRGHFLTEGVVNGAGVRFMVDTGATMVSLGAGDAARAGIDTRKGEPVTTMTANGPTLAYRVKIHQVRVGDITLHDVDGLVHGQNLPVALLGMSFLNRMEMRRDGSTMTLRQRY